MYALFEKIVTAFSSQPWILAFLIVAAGVGYLITLVIKNTTLTSAFASRISDVDTAEIVKEIRNDQILHNSIRLAQADAITKIETRLGLIEQDVEELKCKRIGCNSRITDKKE
jgi:uncharacterized protein (DUF2342 family)